MPKNENGAKKNAHIFKNNTPTLLKLGVDLDHMYNVYQGPEFFSCGCERPQQVKQLQKVLSPR